MASSLLRRQCCAALPTTVRSGKKSRTSSCQFPMLHLVIPSDAPNKTPGFTPAAVLSRSRRISTTACAHSKDYKDQMSAADLHALYHDQMKEIQSERETIFGTSDGTVDGVPNHAQTAKLYLSEDGDPSQFAPAQSNATAQSSHLPPDWDAEEAYAEREAIYAFSEEEKTAWSNNVGTAQISSSDMRRMRKLIRSSSQADASDDKTSGMDTPQPAYSTSPFSHLTPQGDGVSMVDVGKKTSTRRVAVARSVVNFPPEVLSAFQVSEKSGEMIGPKGPIFETAKIAGIMGAKKTSDLIPLCHPLPLDRVNINIQLVNNQAIIECECRVTHKTGVEMEALLGASIAALTIYDMVKAVSHRVEIGRTVLVSKSGGKSDFVHN